MSSSVFKPLTMFGVNGLWGYIVPCFMFSCAVSSFALNRQETLSADSLTADDRKIVALLERIQVKMKALSEREKVEFVAKMADYRDKFESSLDKVEKIPGMMGLDVANLRLSLGLASHAEDLEEVHIEDVPWYEDPKQSKSFGSVESMVRKAATPKNVKSSARKEPTMNDLYDALLQLLELTIVQVLQKAEEDDSVDVILDPFEDKRISQQQAMMNAIMAQPMRNFMPFYGINPMMASVNPMMASVNPMMASVNPMMASVNPLMTSMNPLMTSMNPTSQAMNPMLASMNRVMNPMMASLHQSSMDLAAHAQAMSMMDMPPQQPNPYYRTPSSPNPYGGTDSGIRVPSEKEKIEKLKKKVMKKEKIGKKNVEERRKRSV